MTGDRRRGQIFIVIASIAWSTAGVLQRGVSSDVASQIFGRAFITSIVMALVALPEMRATGQTWRAMGWPGLGFAVCLAGASGSFIVALNETSVASVLFVQTLAPFVAVILAWFVLRERATRRTWIAVLISVLGVAIMAGFPKDRSLLGFAAAGVMTVLFSITMILARHRRDITMAPAVAVGMLLLSAAALPFADLTTLGAQDWVLLASMGVFQMGLGQICFVRGARLLPAADVAIITLLESVLGPLWVWIFNDENPGVWVLVGGAVVSAAVVYQATERATPLSVAAAAP